MTNCSMARTAVIYRAWLGRQGLRISEVGRKQTTDKNRLVDRLANDLLAVNRVEHRCHPIIPHHPVFILAKLHRTQSPQQRTNGIRLFQRSAINENNVPMKLNPLAGEAHDPFYAKLVAYTQPHHVTAAGR